MFCNGLHIAGRALKNDNAISKLGGEPFCTDDSSIFFSA